MARLLGLLSAKSRASRGAAFLLGLFLLIFLPILSGCDHLFYFPDDQVRLTPAKLDLDYDEHVVIEADGTEIYLWHIHPQGSSQHTVIVQFHGNAQNMSSHFLFSAWLAGDGYDVVTFDYRGYGHSTGIPTRQGLLADGDAVLDWVEHAPQLRGKALVVFAQSLGSAVAVPLVARAAPGRIRALVVESGFDSYRVVARRKLADIWLTWPFQYPLSFLIADGYDPITYAPEVHVPYLGIHGTSDPVVPLEHGRALFTAIGSKDKQFWDLPDAGHTPAFGDERSPWRERLLAYLKLHTSAR